MERCGSVNEENETDVRNIVEVESRLGKLLDWKRKENEGSKESNYSPNYKRSVGEDMMLSTGTGNLEQVQDGRY